MNDESDNAYSLFCVIGVIVVLGVMAMSAADYISVVSTVEPIIKPVVQQSEEVIIQGADNEPYLMQRTAVQVWHSTCRPNGIGCGAIDQRGE